MKKIKQLRETVEYRYLGILSNYLVVSIAFENREWTGETRNVYKNNVYWFAKIAS